MALTGRRREGNEGHFGLKVMPDRANPLAQIHLDSSAGIRNEITLIVSRNIAFRTSSTRPPCRPPLNASAPPGGNPRPPIT